MTTLTFQDWLESQFGQPVNVTITGTNADDVIKGSDGAEYIRAGDGNDRIILRAAGSIFGEGGNDVLVGSAGADYLDGGAGDDYVRAGDGADIIIGGFGTDRLYGEAGNDAIDGGEGDDLLVGGDGDDQLFGGDGNDVLRGDAGNDLLDGGDGDDRLHGGDGDDTLIGGDGADLLYGYAGDDRIYGGSGNDVLIGDAGSGWLDGGDGDDLIRGGDDDDVLIGGSGDDRLYGQAGNDLFVGGLGSDRILGDGGIDIVLYDGPMADYGVDIRTGYALITKGSDVDILGSVEYIRFSDATVNLAAAFGLRLDPLAYDDVVSLPEDGVGVIDVLANDLDDGDLIVASVGDAGHGTVSVGDNGVLSYTPDADFAGEDQFTYSVRDGDGNTSEATVYVSVAAENDAPVAEADVFTVAAGEQGVEGNLLANDQDPDGDALSAVAAEGATESGGSYSIASDGTFVYHAADGFSGIDQLTYTVTDDSGAATVGSITVTVEESDSGTVVEEPAPAPAPTLPEGDGSTSLPDGSMDNPPERPAGSGRELWVGEGEAYASLQEVSAVAQEGDTIYVRAGTYVNDYATFDVGVSIIGVGGQAHFQWQGLEPDPDSNLWVQQVGKPWIPNGKGILDFTPKAGDVYVENLTFSGANVSDRNGAGIRFHGRDLTVVNSVFFDNEDGILAFSNQPDNGVVRIYSSEFAANGYEDGLAHAMYVKTGTLLVENSYIHDTIEGHHVKSLSHTTIVRGSVLDDGDGTSSYAVDVSTGGNLLIENNTIVQSEDTGNRAILNYSVDRGGFEGDVVVRGNTIIDHMANGTLVNNGSEATVQFDGNAFETPNGRDLDVDTGKFAFTGNTLNGQALSDFDHLTGATLGTDGDDVMQGTLAGDLVATGAGDDIVSLGSFHDTWFGGDGDDLAFGGAYNDSLYGEAGVDRLVGGTGHDRLFGGAGNDILYGNDGGDTLIGSAGDDILIGGGGGDTVNGGEGIDTAVIRGAFGDFIYNEAGGRHFFGGSTDQADFGRTSLANVEYVQFLDGVLDLGSGEFTAGEWRIDPGLLREPTDPFEPQTDHLALAQPFAAEATLRSGTEASLETVTGGDGADLLYGGGGAVDTLIGGNGNDVYVGDDPTVQIVETSGGGVDTLVLTGDWGKLADNVEILRMAGDANATGHGNDGDNLLIGNAGRNSLFGGDGNDVLEGGEGADRLVGGAGADTFQFSQPNPGKDFITDFDVTQDMIAYDASLAGGASASEVLASATDGQYGAIIDIGDLHVVLARVGVADLNESHFTLL